MGNTVASLNARLGLVVADFQAGLRNAERSMQRSAGRMSRLGNDLSMAVSLPLAAIGFKSLQAAGDMEALRLAIETTMKDAGYSTQQATKELEELRKAALAPGLDFEQAVKASIRLQNVGLKAEEARETIKQLANTISLSGGTAEDLDGVTIQMAQMISKGKIMSSDLRIIQERMPKISSLMKEAFGTSNAEEMQKMGVTGVEFVEKMTKQMTGLSRVSGGLSNAFVNFQSSVTHSLAALGEEIDKTFDVKGNLEKFATWISEAVKGFGAMSDGTKKMIVGFGGTLIVLGPVFKILGAIKGLAGTMIGIFGSLINVLSGTGATAVKLATAFARLGAAQRALVLGVTGLIAAGIIGYLVQWSNELSEVEKSQERVNEAISRTQTEINKETIENGLLFDTLRKVQLGTDERAAALDKLRAKYPDYIGNLTLEKLSLSDINTLQNSINAGLIKSTALKIKAAAQSETATKIAEKMTRITQLQSGANVTLSEASEINAFEMMKFGSTSKAVIDMIKGEITGLNKELSNLDTEFDKTFGLKAQGGSIVKTEDLDRFYSMQDQPIDTKAGMKKPGVEKAGKSSGKKGTKEKEQVNVLAELSKALEMADKKALALGTSYDATSEKAELFKKAAFDLIEQGVSPQDESIQTLVSKYQALGLELELLPQKWEPIGITMGEMATSVQENTIAIGGAFTAMGDAISSAMLNAADSMKQLAMSGETSFKALGKAALKGAADVLRAKIIEGVAAVVADSLEKFGLLGLAIAGGAGAAAGVLFNTVIKGLKIPAFADGGMVDSPTMAMFGEYPGAKQNPEFALRQDQLQGLLNKAAGSGGGLGGNVMFRIQGRDLVAVLDEANNDRSRVRGF